MSAHAVTAASASPRLTAWRLLANNRLAAAGLCLILLIALLALLVPLLPLPDPDATAPAERLKPVLTDGLSFLIIDQQILPRFRAGDMPGGIEAGVDAIAAQLTLPREEAQRIAAQASARPQSSDGSIVPMLPFGFFILVFFILPLVGSIMGGGKRRYRGGRAAPIVWLPGGFSGGSRGGSFGGSFGGFSGGGGGFGGGGASGSW